MISQKNYFDTSAVEQVINLVTEYNSNAMIVIKSTVPVGFTEKIRKQFVIETLFLVQSFYEKGKQYMIICILVV